ncbi:MAG TPA: hypothetical protein VK453_00575 [Micromonosporaceae bacterium]|nr:hypothetical protein [Micromonosporaceae bacterium]
MPPPRVARALSVATLLAAAQVIGAGCNQARPDTATAPATAAPSGQPPAPVVPPDSVPDPPGSDALASPHRPRPSLGWTVTVYYTAVERFHSGSTTRVTGCAELDCANGRADLGAFPDSFVRAVRDEGTGRTAAGRYLNWSFDVGYWIDEAPRDSRGSALRPFESAAADTDVIRPDTRFTIATCGRDEDGSPVAAHVCDRLRTSRWTITDEFTPGLGGTRSVDVYIGEETGPAFTESPWYATLHGASLALP